MRFLLTLGYVTSALALATQTAKFTERSDVIALESAAQSTHGENALALRGYVNKRNPYPNSNLTSNLTSSQTNQDSIGKFH